jgi:hypothetical protein
MGLHLQSQEQVQLVHPEVLSLHCEKNLTKNTNIEGVGYILLSIQNILLQLLKCMHESSNGGSEQPSPENALGFVSVEWIDLVHDHVHWWDFVLMALILSTVMPEGLLAAE